MNLIIIKKKIKFDIIIIFNYENNLKMWQTKKNNLICGYLEAYENQKKHIERVLSAKEITKSTISPYYPKFLKLKLCKHHLEEERKEKIKEENRILLCKILNAEEKPSKYSKINIPKRCPAFDKELVHLKRIKNEIKNYQENYRFYTKIENISSHYSNEELNQRKKLIDENKKLLQKSIFDINPSLLFLSPLRIKQAIEKYKNCSMKRCNSAIGFNRQKIRGSKRCSSAKNIRKNGGNKIYEKNEILYNDGFLGPIPEDEEEKNKENNNEQKEIKDKKSLNSTQNKSKNNNSLQKSNKIKTNQNIKKQRPKSSLKRNESQINLLN